MLTARTHISSQSLTVTCRPEDCAAEEWRLGSKCGIIQAQRDCRYRRKITLRPVTEPTHISATGTSCLMGMPGDVRAVDSAVSTCGICDHVCSYLDAVESAVQAVADPVVAVLPAILQK